MSRQVRLPTVLLAVSLGGCGVLGSPPSTPAARDAGVATSPPAVPTTPTVGPVTEITPQDAGSPGSLPGIPGNPPGSFAELVRRAGPAVVNIAAAGVVREVVPTDPFHLGVPRERLARSLGTGFLIDSQGTILTNNHVVADAQQIRVQLADDRELDAQVVGRDRATDVAVLRIPVTGVPFLPLGDSDAVQVGDWVFAIGNPFGLSQTVTAGILSARNRTGDEVPLDPAGYYSFLQTDASINPGNSGGPLLDTHGAVIGINTAINAEGQGIGFAIPMAMVRQILPMLLRDGHVTRSWIGIGIESVDERMRRSLDLPDRHGALVASVVPGGPGDGAGLRPGDVIVGFDGRPIRSGQELPWLASMAGVGHVARLRVMRSRQAVELRITLGQMPEPSAPQGPPMRRPIPMPPMGPFGRP